MSKNGDNLVIRLRNIKRLYEVGVERIYALNGVDLDIYENEYVAVMGHSGSGKSTLMNVLGCLDRPSSGTYELDEHLVSERAIRHLRWCEMNG